jgi:hypothetical protein
MKKYNAADARQVHRDSRQLKNEAIRDQTGKGFRVILIRLILRYSPAHCSVAQKPR